MPVYLDVKSRLDTSAANLAAREAVRLFDRAGQDASKAFTNPLSKALGSLDMSAMRRQLDLLSGDYAKLAASEEEAARRMVRSMGQVEVAQKRLAEATAKYGADSSKAAAANVALADSHAIAARNTKQHVDAMVASEAAAANLSRATDDAGKSAGRAGQLFNAAGIGSVALFGAALVETTKKAGDFQASQTKLITSAGESAQNLKLVSDGLLEMAGKVGFSTQELSKGMYIVESGGYHGAEGLKVMKAAAQGAAAEQSDLTTVNNALTTSLHDFGFGADMAADVMSKMIAAVGAGKTNIQEFSGALHSVEPAAAAAHIKLEDVYGTLAMITQSGESADQATENMRNAINSLAQPTSQQREAMSQFGVSADDVSQKLGERGLAGSMQYLSEAILKHMDPAGKISVSELNQNAQAAQNATAMLDQMSPAARKSSEAFKDHAMGSREYTMAIRGANDEDSAKMKQFLALENTVNGFSSRFKNGKDIIETYNAALKDVTGTVAGQTVALQVTGDHAQATNDLIHTLTGTTREHDGTVKGFNETQQTLNQKMAEAKAAFGAAAIELGTVFVPMMTNVANAAKWVGDEFAKHPGIAQDVTVAVGAMGAAWLAIKAYNIASTILSPISNGLVGLTRMLGGVELQAGTAGVAMRGMGAAAQEGAVGVEAAAAEEVTAEQTVTASALEADAAMSGGGAAGGGGPGKGRFRSGLRGFAGALPIVGPTTMAALEAGKQLNPNNDLSHVADNQDWGHMLLGQSWDWIHGRAAGGPIYGHGPKGRDSVPALLAPGEHVLTHHDVAAMGGQGAVYNFRSALHRQYGGDVGGDDGGPVSRLYQEARTLNGGRYVWGSTDCSGAVSMLVDAALGTSGRMSTATAAQWLASKGFQSGMGGPGSLSIGWYNGGPGGGHMAATLPDGTHFESGGQHGGIMLGGSAAGAETSEFTSHMHLPLQGFYPDGPAGGMGGVAGAFGGGGFGGGGSIPAGSTAGTGPGGQAGYYTPSPEKVASAQERLRHLDEEIRIAEERKTHMKADASQAEKDRLDEEIRHLKEERGQEEGRLAKAERGTFHAGRGGGGRGGKAGLPVPLDDHFGLGKGLPGLAEYAVSFLEDLVLGPLETAAMAQFGGGMGGGSGMPSGAPADLVSAFGGVPGGGGGPSGGGGSGSGGAEGPGSRTAGGGGGPALWWTGGQASPARSAPTPWWTGGQPHPSAPASPRLDVPPPDMTPPWMSSLDPRGRTPGTGAWWLPSIAPQDFNPNFPGSPPGFSGGAGNLPPGMAGVNPGAVQHHATGGFINGNVDSNSGTPGVGSDVTQPNVPGWWHGGGLGDMPWWYIISQWGGHLGTFSDAPGGIQPGTGADPDNPFLPIYPSGGHGPMMGFSTGGPSGTDTVPAWLSPGEFVMNADATKQFGSSLQWMNAQHYDTGTSGPIDVHGNTPPAPQPAPAAPPQGAMSPKPGQGQPGGKTAGPLPLPGLVGASPLPAMDQGNKPSSDIHNLPGLATPGADSPGMGAGLPASPGIGFSGGVIGAAEGAASSAGDMMAPGSGAAMQIAFQEINRAASFGAQAAGIGVEGLLEALLPSSGAVGGDFAKTIPGRLLMGVTGVRPTGQNTAGNTTGPAAQSEGGGQGGGVGFQLNGDMHVHTPDAHSFGDQMQSETQAAGGTYPFATAGR